MYNSTQDYLYEDVLVTANSEILLIYMESVNQAYQFCIERDIIGHHTARISG